MSHDAPSELTDDQRRRLIWLAALPVAVALTAYPGQILSGTLLTSAPLALLALNASDPFLLLVANQTTLGWFVLVGFTRLFLPDLFLYQIGLEFGPDTRRYLDGEFGRGNRLTRALDWLERWFPRVGYLLLFALPGYPTCLICGIAKMNRIGFIVVNVAGTITRLVVIYKVSEVFSGPVGSVVSFINRYSVPFTVVMVVLVIMQARRAAERTEDD